MLPDSSNGRAVAAFLVVALCALACAFSQGRLPLWSALLGTAAIVGAYEEIYTNAPSQFISESPEAGTTVLLATAFGYLATSVVYDLLTTGGDEDGDNAGAQSQSRHGSSADRTETDPDAVGQIDTLMTGDKK